MSMAADPLKAMTLAALSFTGNFLSTFAPFGPHVAFRW